MKVAVITAKFNEFLTEPLLQGALDEFRKGGLEGNEMLIFYVPGTFEIPWACQKVIEHAKPDGVLALGVIMRGETEHHHHLGHAVLDQLVSLSMQKGVPICSGILVVDDMQQAMERIGGKFGHKGRESARALLECIHLLAQLKR